LSSRFVALGALWPQPRLQADRARRLCFFPSTLVDIVCGVIRVGVFGAVVYAGLAGVQSGPANLAPTFVYVVFWVGLAFASLLLGNVFGAFNPWRALARAVAALTRAIRSREAPAPLEYPRAGLAGGPPPWGCWPSRGSSSPTPRRTTRRPWRFSRWATPPSSTSA